MGWCEQLPACTVNNRPFPVALDGKLCTRFEIAEFTTRCKELGVRYLGVCCGAGTLNTTHMPHDAHITTHARTTTHDTS